jgi:hypothetical protein
MAPLVNAAMHSHNQLLILVLLVEPSLEQPVLLPTPRIGNVLVDMDWQLLGAGVMPIPTGLVHLVDQSFQDLHAV